MSGECVVQGSLENESRGITGGVSRGSVLCRVTGRWWCSVFGSSEELGNEIECILVRDRRTGTSKNGGLSVKRGEDGWGSKVRRQWLVDL